MKGTGRHGRWDTDARIVRFIAIGKGSPDLHEEVDLYSWIPFRFYTGSRIRLLPGET